MKKIKNKSDKIELRKIEKNIKKERIKKLKRKRTKKITLSYFSNKKYNINKKIIK